MAIAPDFEFDFREVPLERQRASLSEYLGAVADDAWSGNPLPSLLRWYERQQADHGMIGAAARLIGAPFGTGDLLGQGVKALSPDFGTSPQSRWLSKDEVDEKGKELGLKLGRPMSEQAFEMIAAERRRKLGHQLVYDRARVGGELGLGGQALSVLLEFAVNAVDPINLASAFVPVSRIPFVAGQLARIGSPGVRRLAAGAIEGAAGNAMVEPLVALAAVDEDPHYGFSAALTSIAFGAALGGGLHWLGGAISDRRSGAPRPLPGERSSPLGREAADVLGGPPEPARTVPQPVAEAIEALRPETRQALFQTYLRQAANDLKPDGETVARLDPRWHGLPAAPAGAAPAARFAPAWDVATIRRELAEQAADLASLRQHEALAAATADTGRRFAAPADFVPSAGELQAARDYVQPPKTVREPESLAQFVRRQGGMDKDALEAGDLRAMDLGRSGLLTRKKRGPGSRDPAKIKLGRKPDDLALAAFEAGYYPERPDLTRFLADLIDDAQGQRKTFADLDKSVEAKAAREEADAWESFMGAHPLGDPRGMSERDLAYFLSRDPIERRTIELDDMLARGEITRDAAVERAWLLDRSAAADERDRAREMIEQGGRPEGYERELEADRLDEDHLVYQTEEEFNAVQQRAGLPEDPRENVSGGPGRPDGAGGGEERGAPRPVQEPATATSPGALPRTGAEIAATESVGRGGYGLPDARPGAIDPANPRSTLHLTPEALAAQQADIRALVESARGGMGMRRHWLGRVSDAGAAFLNTLMQDAFRAVSQRSSRDVSGYTHSIDAQHVVHALKMHGPGASLHKGEIPLTPADFEKIPLVLADPGSVEVTHVTRLTKPATLLYSRREGDTVFVVEQVWEKQQQLAFLTMWKERADGGSGTMPSPQGAAPPPVRPEPSAALQGDPERYSVGAENIGQTSGPGQGQFSPLEFPNWIERQGDWRQDAHIDIPAAQRAAALVEERGPVTPEQDLAELQKATAALLDDPEIKAELDAAVAPYAEAKAMADAYAGCKLGGGA